MSNPPTERPWPASASDTGWWRGEGPPPPPDQDQFQDLSRVPAEPGAPRAGELDADAFPLWPATGAVLFDGEGVEGALVVDDGPLPPPAYLGAPGPSRIRSEEFATVVLEAVAAHRVPLAPTVLPAGPASPLPELTAAPEVPEDAPHVRRPAPDVVWPVNPLPDPPTSGPQAPPDEPAPPVPGRTGEGKPMEAKPVPGKKRKEAAEQWPPPQMLAMTQARSSTARVLAPRVAVRPRPTRHVRQPAPALAWLLVFALLATFFAYTAAEPTWLALGHETRGTATVGRCQGAGVLRRCAADFVSGRFEAAGVALVGADRAPGAVMPARMVGADGRIAYAGSDRALLVRGLVGLLLVLLCGLGIAWATGAGRLASRRARTVARTLSVALPLLVAIGVLAASY